MYEYTRQSSPSMLGCLATALAAPVVGYAAVRVLEHRALSNLPTLERVMQYPLSRLYRHATHAERARLRRQRAAKTSPAGLRFAHAVHHEIKLLRMRQLGWVPTGAYRLVRIEQSLERAMRGLDDIVDGDARPTSGTRQEMFAHVTRLLAGFDDPRALQEQAQPEDLVLIYALVASRRLAGIDLLPGLRTLWDDYTPDARRIMRGDPVADRVTIARSHRAYVRFGYLCALLSGLSEDRAQLAARLDVPNLTAFDNLVDLARDARAGHLNIPREALEEAGIDPSDMVGVSSWPELIAVPGLLDWYLSEVERHATHWEDEALPVLMREVAPYIRPRLAQVWMIKGWRLRRAAFAQLRRNLRAYTSDDGSKERHDPERMPPVVPTSPLRHSFPRDDELPADAPESLLSAPSGWLAIADVMAAVAESFGVPVSAATRERWRRFWGCAWLLDQLLDESPDLDRAADTYRRLITTAELLPTDTPSSLGPVRLATGLLKSSLTDNGSGEVIQLALRLPQYASLKAEASSLPGYLRTVVREDSLTAMIALACMSGHERESPGFDAFTRWCISLVVFGGLRDAAADLTRDAEQGRVAIRPVAPSRWILRCGAWLVFAHAAVAHPKALMAAARSAAQYRLSSAATRPRDTRRGASRR